MHVDPLERIWMIISVAVLGVFFAALVAGAVVFDVRLPGPVARVDPLDLGNTEFAEPGLRNMGNGEYTAHFIAQMWAFTPTEIEVPVGSHVTFIVTSRDVTHGFLIERHNINFMVIPGQISRQSVTFNEEGVFYIYCNEFCGTQHHVMQGRVIVTGESAIVEEEPVLDEVALVTGE